jgi:hypothetical protein
MGTTSTKKPSPDFLIRLVGGNIKPWLVPTRTLSRVLGAVQRLVDQRDDLVDDEEEERTTPGAELLQERTLKLLTVTSRSAGYAVAAQNTQPTLSLLRDTGTAIENPNTAEWHPATISSLDELSQIAKALGCVIELRSAAERGYGDVLATIRPSTFADVHQRAFVFGHTSVCGRLERVGGATAMRCGIHVHERSRMLFCRVMSADLVRELGKHIYTDVVLSGQAVWYRFNNQLKSLAVSAFDPARTVSFSEIAREIRDSGGNAWDSIADPEAFIREMRG